jgi:hypothetical protein
MQWYQRVTEASTRCVRAIFVACLLVLGLIFLRIRPAFSAVCTTYKVGAAADNDPTPVLNAPAANAGGAHSSADVRLSEATSL